MDTDYRKTDAPRIEYPESALHMFDVQNSHEKIAQEQYRMERELSGNPFTVEPEEIDLRPHRGVVSNALSKLAMGSGLTHPTSQLIVVHLTGLPRESLLTTWGLIELTDQGYEWRIAQKPTTAALLAERLPFLREYIRTRMEWMIAYIEDYKTLSFVESSASENKYYDERLADLRRQLKELEMTADLPNIR